jgi:hypothetical protein
MRCEPASASSVSHTRRAGDGLGLERIASRPPWGSPAHGGANRWGRHCAEPQCDQLVAFPAAASSGLKPSRAFSCGLERPHAASGCLSAATPTNRPGNERFLAAALGANSLKPST